MPIKKRLQALAKLASGSDFDVYFWNGWGYTTDGVVAVSSQIPGIPDGALPAADIAAAAKAMTARDDVAPALRPRGEPLRLVEPVPEDLPTTTVDPFQLKQLLDAVCASWDGPKSEAVVEIRFDPDSSTITVHGNGIVARLRSAVPC